MIYNSEHPNTFSIRPSFTALNLCSIYMGTIPKYNVQKLNSNFMQIVSLGTILKSICGIYIYAYLIYNFNKITIILMSLMIIPMKKSSSNERSLNTQRRRSDNR